MKLKAKKAFSWAHRGVDVKYYEAGDEIETDEEDLATVGKAEGWVDVIDEGTGKPEKKTKSGAPENKAA